MCDFQKKHVCIATVSRICVCILIAVVMSIDYLDRNLKSVSEVADPHVLAGFDRYEVVSTNHQHVVARSTQMGTSTALQDGPWSALQRRELATIVM